MSPSQQGGRPDNIAAAIADVSERASVLVREEIELAKAEVTEKVTKLVKGAVVGVAAGVFFLMALFFVLVGCAWLLYYFLPVGEFAYFWGFFAMAVILIALGVVAGLIAAKVVKRGAPPVPTMAIEEAQKIKQTVSAPPGPPPFPAGATSSAAPPVPETPPPPPAEVAAVAPPVPAPEPAGEPFAPPPAAEPVPVVPEPARMPVPPVSPESPGAAGAPPFVPEPAFVPETPPVAPEPAQEPPAVSGFEPQAPEAAGEPVTDEHDVAPPPPPPPQRPEGGLAADALFQKPPSEEQS